MDPGDQQKKKKKEDTGKITQDPGRFILMVLLEEGPVAIEQLDRKVLAFVNWFGFVPKEKERKHSRKTRRHGRYIKFDSAKELELLVKKGHVVKTEVGLLELTDAGREIAKDDKEKMERRSAWLNKNVMNPAATARNTVFIDLFLAIIKLLAGFLSGSVAMLADGADGAVDTTSATVVWIGIRIKREIIGTLVIIAMILITGVIIGYESVETLWSAYNGDFEAMGRPYLVIVVEVVAMMFALLLTFYQGMVGKKFRSLALISQSIDSRNHIFVAMAVIVGAVFSIFGIHYMDAIIGTVIAGRMLLDGGELLMEARSSMKGEETDFDKREGYLERSVRRRQMDGIRTWVLYSLNEEGPSTEERVLEDIETTFKREYIPLMSEFRSTPILSMDFEADLPALMEPLLEEGLVEREEEGLAITPKGRRRLQSSIYTMKYTSLE
jgi:divalent metal cation (Fe/Co/Zn/Cd) transporter/predicted transcriptional regulator